jgi:hypothetical protein
MQQDHRAIPLPIVKLMICFFSHTNNDAERDALEEWICADDDVAFPDQNKKLFRDLPQTDDMEVLYHWLVQKTERNTGLN